MNRTPGKSLFWRVGGPVLGYFAIVFFAQIIIGCILVIINKEMLAEVMLANSSDGTALYENLMLASSDIVWMYYAEISAITALCTIPLSLALFIKDRKHEIKNNIPVNRKASAVKYLMIPVLGFAICFGFNCFIIMTNLAFMSSSYQELSGMLYSASFPMQILCLGVIGPVAEELLFRGIVFRRLREYTEFKIAAICSSLFFLSIHSNMLQMAYTFVLGMFLAYVYEKYGSIKAPILLHISVNMVSLICTEFMILDLLFVLPKLMAFSIVFCVFVGTVMFVTIKKIEEKPLTDTKE